MVLVRWAAAAMKTSGEAMISYPAEWCSPNQASSKPSASRCSTSCRSRSSARVGFWPTGWNGARKIPNLRRPSASMVVIALQGYSMVGGGGTSGRDQDLAVFARCTQCGEGARCPGQVDGGGDQEVGARHPVGQAPERGGELGRG